MANQNRQPGKSPQDNRFQQLFRNSFFPALLVIILLYFVFSGITTTGKEVDYSEFKNLVKEGKITCVVVSKNSVDGGTDFKKLEYTASRVDDAQLTQFLESNKVTIRGENRSFGITQFLITWVLPFVLIIAFWSYILRRMGGAGEQVISFGKNRAKLYTETEEKITFNDVAGAEEAKVEMIELVEFLKNPGKFQKLGGKLPKGVLLVGPPGTGKTLLARATAGEANVPFLSLSGSDFVEMFVGVGAARVRDLFDRAQKKAPCIIFIDEIDAIGRHRGAGGLIGAHDEREQTLNQLLAEMDGFDTHKGVIIIAATNRPDVLDTALLRPGRFDRQIVVDAPDLKGRLAILKVHTRKLRLAPNVDLDIIAQRTPGFVGADLANICNEAALLAARRNKDAIETTDLEDAIDRVLAGPEKKSRLINQSEKRIVAIHESGHALVGLLTPGADPVTRVSIIPRGYAALGWTQSTPKEDRYLITKTEILGRIKMTLGGRAAEDLILGEISTGAQNDLQKATEYARSMIIEYGMSERLGLISIPDTESSPFLSRRYYSGTSSVSSETAREIEIEIKNILDDLYKQTLQVLRENRNKLEELSESLLEKETLEKDELLRIVEKLDIPAPPNIAIVQ
ncbi:MAG: cell division protein FtsH [Acidobacteria bacterium]|nr:MAG: cell division protein FtsH [Acidobacteriota bacterium]